MFKGRLWLQYVAKCQKRVMEVVRAKHPARVYNLLPLLPFLPLSPLLVAYLLIQQTNELDPLFAVYHDSQCCW